jgi:lipid II:glycine glycyltransferase (peptidoglycan interpeptide bridge formation enzyme)
MNEITTGEWESFLTHHPNAHILQSAAWGQLKADFGWRVLHLTLSDCGAQLLIKQVLPGIRFAYIPKGPVGVNLHNLWQEIDPLCRQLKCVFLKVEPDSWPNEASNGVSSQQQIPNNYRQSDHSIQPKQTLIIDISDDESQILGRMKQKTRYNINLAMKKNVIVKPRSDLDSFYHLMEITGQRDQFGIHSSTYYQRAYDLFHIHDQCQLLVAEYEGIPLSALMVFVYGTRAWYFYGASSNSNRDLMPNYLLQWEAIRWAKSKSCKEYDLWGIPDADLATLEANYNKLSTGLWGVYRFKRGFGGELRRSSGAWDRVYNPYLYRLYTLWLNYRKVEG